MDFIRQEVDHYNSFTKEQLRVCVCVYLCVCVCVCIHVYAYIYIYLYIYTYIYIQIHIYIYINIYIYVCVCTQTYTQTHLPRSIVAFYTHTCYIYLHTYWCMHVHKTGARGSASSIGTRTRQLISCRGNLRPRSSQVTSPLVSTNFW